MGAENGLIIQTEPSLIIYKILYSGILYSFRSKDNNPKDKK